MSDDTPVHDEDVPFDEGDDDTDAGHPEEFGAEDVEPADEEDDDGEE